MKQAPLTLDTLQSKTAEFDSVFFFLPKSTDSWSCFFLLLFSFYFWQRTQLKVGYTVVAACR